ncbi:MAG: hypothetical protein PHC34_09295 [Candidatus Gastranaerophilales bacterium]|nr:hypothetical protein [Candidatus Gastranaerophilales bacterium]
MKKMKMLAIFSVLGLLFQIGSVQAVEIYSGYGLSTGGAAVCPVESCPACPVVTIPAVPLNKYLENNGFKPNDIKQVVPVPPAQPVMTGGAASISAVPLKDYAKDNGFKPDKIKQYVPVPPAKPCPTGCVTPVAPVIMQPILTPAPQVIVKPCPTGGAAPQSKYVKGYW